MLLNKAVLALAKLAPVEESRYTLGSVAIESENAIVTNGHYLVSVGHTTMSPESYPELPAVQTDAKQLGSDKPLLLAREAALAALKTIKSIGKRMRHLPILHNAALCQDGKLYVNTLESVNAFSTGSQEGRFPNWRAVMPQSKPQAQITLSANYIQLLAAYFAEHGAGECPAVRLTIYGEQSACRFDARTEDGQDITAILMPLRAENSQFAARPSDVAEPELAEPVAA